MCLHVFCPCFQLDDIFDWVLAHTTGPVREAESPQNHKQKWRVGFSQAVSLLCLKYQSRLFSCFHCKLAFRPDCCNDILAFSILKTLFVSFFLCLFKMYHHTHFMLRSNCVSVSLTSIGFFLHYQASTNIRLIIPVKLLLQYVSFKYLSLVTAYLSLNIEIYMLCPASELLQRVHSRQLGFFQPFYALCQYYFFMCHSLLHVQNGLDLNSLQEILRTMFKKVIIK